MSRYIDLNADLGEDDSAEGIARDTAMMAVISSCNIACGGHAGTPAVMQAMLVAAKEYNVVAGAHPSYPDRANFGRVSVDLPLGDLQKSLAGQIEVLLGEAMAAEMQLGHIKPHGALYNDAQDNPALAGILVELAQEYSLPLVSMPESIVEQQARQSGVPFVGEAFIDRRYRQDARLVSRREPGAVLVDEGERIAQGLALALGDPILSDSGDTITISAATLCLHSDSDGALATARAMRDALVSADFQIAAAVR